MAQSGAGKVTTDHDEIRRWVEERGGSPATVKRTRKRNDPGLIRIDYPGFSGEGTLEAISWEEFFEKFEENGLAFVYQDQTATGRPSRFSKLVRRDTAAARGGAGRASQRAKRSEGASSEQARTGARAGAKRKAATGSARRKTSAAKTGRRSTATTRADRRKRSS